MDRIVIGPNWIGDAVMSLPVLRALRRAHPSDGLTVLAPRGPAAIYGAEASADTVLVRAGLAGDVARLRRRRFGEAWLLPNSFHAALIAFLSGVPQRIGYATDSRGFLLTGAPAPPSGTGHQLRDYDLLLRARGIAPDLEPPRLPISAAARAAAQEVLRLAGLPAEAPLVLLCPGSAVAPTKRWPAERYARLSDALAARGFARAIAIGPNERALGESVAKTAGTPIPVLGADLGPAELAALLSCATVAVTNDSGPMHLAAAVGIPVVALFGPTDPGRTSPSGARHRVLDRYVFCSPCFRNDCPFGHECMKEITVEAVARAVEELLSGQERDPSLRSG